MSEKITVTDDIKVRRADLRVGGAWTLRWDYNGWKRIEKGLCLLSTTSHITRNIYPM